MNIRLPEEVEYIINALEGHGYEAYTVGGCVRDAVMGEAPKDWDICTNALPEQTKKCFEGGHIIETGLKHGTITLVINHKPFEITTYRVDGVYSDNRRPDTVEFVRELKEDLSRRDFTINAMAYNPKTGVVDYFNGKRDIQNKTIRCVGAADERFKEDALRVMRALRFSSVLGFSIDGSTEEAIIRNKSLLKNIAVERIAVELNKLVAGKGAENVLLRYAAVICEIIPEIQKMIGFRQNSPYHCLDVWQHTVRSVDKAQYDTVLRLAMLFHDIGKPERYTEADSVGHFYGHPQLSADMAKAILLRLKYDNDTIEAVTQLILYHDTDIQPRRKHIKRWLNKIGEERLRLLLEVKRADAMAQEEGHCRARLAVLDEVLIIIDEIIEQNQCFRLKDLAVNGGDLIAYGIPEGIEIGKALNKLMDMVIDEEVENDKEELLKAIKYGGKS